MRKLLTTLGCALAVMAFAATASAEIYTVSEEDIDEFLAKLGAEDLDDDLLDSQLEGVNGGVLDSCVDCRPVCYAVSFQHGANWTVITGGEIQWYPFAQAYGVCYDEDAMTDVDGVRQSWKTTSTARMTCCSYCNSGAFDEGEYYGVEYLITDNRSCWIDAGNSYITVYMAEELSYYNDFDFSPWTSFYRIGRMNSPSISKVDVVDCVQ